MICNRTNALFYGLFIAVSLGCVSLPTQGNAMGEKPPSNEGKSFTAEEMNQRHPPTFHGTTTDTRTVFGVPNNSTLDRGGSGGTTMGDRGMLDGVRVKIKD